MADNHKTGRSSGSRPSGISRRAFLKASAAAAASSLLVPRGLASVLSAAPAAAPAAAKAGKARAVIQIWMWGGPAHMDTFDPKPGTGNDYTGPFDAPIPTNVDGIMVGQMLPLLAKQADKYAILRSMTHGINGHETAAYMVQTGRRPGGRIVYPGVGAVVSYFKGYNAGYTGLIPPYIVLTTLQGRFSEAGFLGARYKPFATGGDPNRTPFAVEGVVAAGITQERQQSRRELLGKLDSFARAMSGSNRFEPLQKARDQAYDLILGDAGKVFDLSGEPSELRDKYGRHTFGQSCLMARRLVEAGVPYVTINYTGWDSHKQHFQEMRRKLPQMDSGMATLLEDLSSRGLLDSTIVWWGGEFGRTPKVQWEAPWNGGRGHYGTVFSTVLAGGGFQGGRVVGASDERAETVKERPIYPCDVIASIYTQLGIDVDARLPHPMGEDVRVMEPDAARDGKIELLKEIM